MAVETYYWRLNDTPLGNIVKFLKVLDLGFFTESLADPPAAWRCPGIAYAWEAGPGPSAQGLARSEPSTCRYTSYSKYSLRPVAKGQVGKEANVCVY